MTQDVQCVSRNCVELDILESEFDEMFESGNIVKQINKDTFRNMIR